MHINNVHFCVLSWSYALHGVSVLHDGKGGGQRGGQSISGPAATHFPLHPPRQGAALRLIVRPGWWTFTQIEMAKECGIVESPSSIPWDPITSNTTTQPPTHTQGSGSTPDLGHSGLGHGGGTVVLLFGLTLLRSISESECCDLQRRHTIIICHYWLCVPALINKAI